jgi:translocation and assembly module TamB
VELAVRIEVPGRLYLRGRGLETELVGRIALAGTLAEPQVSGDLRTQRGTLDVLGKRLELTRGILRWDQGGVVPSLDILATARTSTHAITVALTGLANAPEVQLGSSPDLPPDEVVARLLFDRPTSGLSPFEIIQIAQAVGQLAASSRRAAGWTGALGRVQALPRAGPAERGGDSRGGTAVQAGNYIAPGRVSRPPIGHHRHRPRRAGGDRAGAEAGRQRRHQHQPARHDLRVRVVAGSLGRASGGGRQVTNGRELVRMVGGTAAYAPA